MGNDVLYNGASTAGTHIGRVPDAHQAAERRVAARAVAGNFARDAEDCAQLLAMLGLTPQDGLRKKADA
jgi:hypothetical protein